MSTKAHILSHNWADFRLPNAGVARNEAHGFLRVDPTSRTVVLSLKRLETTSHSIYQIRNSCNTPAQNGLDTQFDLPAQGAAEDIIAHKADDPVDDPITHANEDTKLTDLTTQLPTSRKAAKLNPSLTISRARTLAASRMRTTLTTCTPDAITRMAPLMTM